MPHATLLVPAMKQDASFFEGKEAVLIYIAKRLKDALRLEDALTGESIDYTVETETYLGGIIFRSERVGAFFYVDPEQSAPARAVLTRLDLRPYTE